jgi:CheY-like chemotaxis protein/anti-sigma regulatory factor (Ser/Thr protein kinase)
LVNLLSNAIKFTEEGEVTVTVNSEVLHDGRYRLEFAVKDTGVGIPTDKQASLFQSFSQADNSITREYGGTGLGLAISKRLVELMDGDIQVRSVPGVGSTFTFAIKAAATTAAPPRRAKKIRPQLPGRRILIISGRTPNRRQISRQVKTWGAYPYIAGSLSEVSYWLQKSDTFDLLILDDQQLKANGDLLLEEIQEATAPHTPPLILMQSEAGAETHDGFTFAACIPKPVKPSTLYEVFVRVLSRQKTDPAAPLESLAQQLPLRLLLVEDNLINQRVTTHQLAKLGYTPDLADDGEEALAALRQSSYDVILMDIQMPQMDGVTATRHIREKWPQTQQPWIIALTAHAMEGDRERYLDAGLDDYVSKPVHIEQLVEAFYRYANRQNA